MCGKKISKKIKNGINSSITSLSSSSTTNSLLLTNSNINNNYSSLSSTSTNINNNKYFTNATNLSNLNRTSSEPTQLNRLDTTSNLLNENNKDASNMNTFLNSTSINYDTNINYNPSDYQLTQYDASVNNNFNNRPTNSLYETEPNQYSYFHRNNNHEPIRSFHHPNSCNDETCNESCANNIYISSTIKNMPIKFTNSCKLANEAQNMNGLSFNSRMNPNFTNAASMQIGNGYAGIEPYQSVSYWSAKENIMHLNDLENNDSVFLNQVENNNQPECLIVTNDNKYEFKSCQFTNNDNHSFYSLQSDSINS